MDMIVPIADAARTEHYFILALDALGLRSFIGKNIASFGNKEYFRKLTNIASKFEYVCDLWFESHMPRAEAVAELSSKEKTNMTAKWATNLIFDKIGQKEGHIRILPSAMQDWAIKAFTAPSSVYLPGYNKT